MEVEYIEEDEVKTKIFSFVLSEDKKAFQQIIENYEIQTIHTKEATLEEIFIFWTNRSDKEHLKKSRQLSIIG